MKSKEKNKVTITFSQEEVPLMADVLGRIIGSFADLTQKQEDLLQELLDHLRSPSK